MKKIIFTMLILSIGIIIGYGVSLSGFIAPINGDDGVQAESDNREILYWVAPMDPGYRRDSPGKSPMGMALVPFYANQSDDNVEAGVVIDAAVVNNLGVETVTATRRTLRPKINTVGRLEYNEERLSHVHLRASGWI